MGEQDGSTAVQMLKDKQRSCCWMGGLVGDRSWRNEVVVNGERMSWDKAGRGRCGSGHARETSR